MHQCHSFLGYEILDQNRPVCWSSVVKKKPDVGSSFFGTFPSVPNTTKVICLPLAAISLNYSKEFLYIIPANSGNFLKLLLIFTSAKNLSLS